MFKIEFKDIWVASLLLLAFAGAAFAENSEPTIIGRDVFSFDAPATKADLAAAAYQYDVEKCRRVGTEAGDWEYSFDTPETDADRAAKNYIYNYEHLRSLGTEGGDWQWSFEGVPQCEGLPVAKEAGMKHTEQDS